MIGTVFTKDGKALWGELTYGVRKVYVYDTAKKIETTVPLVNIEEIKLDLLEVPTEESDEEEDDGRVGA